MSVNRAIWRTEFDKKDFPRLPCPQCATGRLKFVENSLILKEPPYSEAYHSHEDFEADWVVQRFGATLRCDEGKCGEIAFMAGETSTVPVFLENDGGYTGWAEQDVLVARSLFPAAPLFPITEQAPRVVKEQLKLGFQLFWSDLAACAGRLRTAVELMLDEQGVTKTIMKKGKLERANLWERIEAFAQSAVGEDLKDQLHALRTIGNLGTHGAAVTSEALFDAADVLEDVLLGVYEKKSLKAKIKKLTDTKGGY